MTDAANPGIVRVTRRFDAQAEHVYDAFLDPARAGLFLFATPTGQIVTCEIDARVGGRFTITDRRHGKDVVHTGTYLELERPRRIVFALSVAAYSTETSTVTIELAPFRRGCHVTLIHDLGAADESVRDRTRSGWDAVLDVAAAVIVDEAPTCGVGVAQHAAIPATIGAMFEALAETLERHRAMLRAGDAATRQEDEVYRELAEQWTRIAASVRETAAQMAAQRELPMATHDETAWGEGHVRAFERFVDAQSHLLGLLRVAGPRDEQMLASMKPQSRGTAQDRTSAPDAGVDPGPPRST